MGWRLEPDGTGTRLTQWRDRTTPPNVLVKAPVASGLRREGMARTLESVRAAAEST